jgi:NADH-quinone oxidoreductase subunit E
MVAIGKDTYEDLTPERLEEIIEAFARGEGQSVPPGPQNDRQFSAPITGPTSLKDSPVVSGKRNGTGPVAKDGPTKPGRKRQVSAEAAPALAGPAGAGKVAVEVAETERKAANNAANANGKPNSAGREAARGAESKAVKIKGGAAVGKDMTKAEPSPGALFVAPEGAPDDLKLISGVGPVLEKKLNDFGVTQFAQIAAFKKADIEKLDEGLNFRGRIARDDWVRQAQALAKGGVEEYRKVFGKDPR